MEQTLRDQTHELIDELSQQQLLTLRMFLDDMLRSSSVADEGPVAPPKRISVSEYRRAMGLVEPR